MRLDEIFNDSYKYELSFYQDKEATARFVADDKSHAMVEISQGRPGTNSVFLAFTRGGKTSTTGKGDAFKIFTTVAQITKEAMGKIKADAIIFSADEAGRASLYKKMAKKLALPDFVPLQKADDLKDHESKLYEFLLAEEGRKSYFTIAIVRKGLVK